MQRTAVLRGYSWGALCLGRWLLADVRFEESLWKRPAPGVGHGAATQSRVELGGDSAEGAKGQVQGWELLGAQRVVSV